MRYVTVTKEQIEELGMDNYDTYEDYKYQDLLYAFIGQTLNTDKPVKVIDLIGGLNSTSDLLEIAYYHLPRIKLIHLAIECTERVQHLVELPIALETFKAAKDLIYHPELYNIRVMFSNLDIDDKNPLVELPRALLRMVNQLIPYRKTPVELIEDTARLVANYSFSRRQLDLVGYLNTIINRVSELDPTFDINQSLTKLFTIEE